MPRNATPSRCHQHAWADQVYILPESASGARRPYQAPVAAFPGRRKGPRFLGARKWMLLPPHGWAAACGEKKFDLSETVARFSDILNKERPIVEIGPRSIFVNSVSVDGSSQQGRVCARSDPPLVSRRAWGVRRGAWSERTVASGQWPVNAKRGTSRLTPHAPRPTPHASRPNDVGGQPGFPGARDWVALLGPVAAQIFRPWIPNATRCQHFQSSLGRPPTLVSGDRSV